MNLLLKCGLATALLTALLLPFFSRAGSPSSTEDWNVTALDQLLASVPAAQAFAQIDDMKIPVTYLRAWRNKLAGDPQPNIAFSGTFTKWTSGNVYYAFDASVSASNKKAFLDATAEWATFANLHFIARSAEANYILVTNNASLGGGQSYVGMVGGAQLLQIGSSSWNRSTLVHELGHALGLVHEHQRSDRDNFVTIVTNNILPGHLPDFVLLTDSQNKSTYDFLSVMHYGRNAFSVNQASNTIQTLPVYNQYLNLMGNSDPVLSASDRAGMAQVYGAGPVITNLVTNTLDGGPGSLRAAIYYAFDHPGTTISFNIPVTDLGYSNNVFNILPSDGFPNLVNAMVIDGSTEPTNSNPNGPEILLNGTLCHTPSVYPSGLRFNGSNCTVRSVIINNFPYCGVLMDGSNTVGNTVNGCYVGIDPTGNSAMTNGLYPVQISGGAVSNIIGGTTIAARNVISGSFYQGLIIRDAGTRFNTVSGDYIGLNAAGSAALSNRWSGVQIFGGAQSNLVGGYSAGARNVISGNGAQGLVISDANSSGNVIAGNYIGLNSSGSAALPNTWAGVEIFGGAQNNRIGGTIPGSGNVISGNTLQGVAIDGAGTTGNRIQGNLIGVNPAGTSAIGNGYAGVNFFGNATANYIGGSLPGAGNVISGNDSQGVLLQDAGTSGNFIQGNLIGLNAAGEAAISNTWSGVEIYNGPTANIVGGISGARNFISGNGNYGVLIDFGSSLNLVQGNTIGLNSTSGAAVPNGYDAVLIYFAPSNAIGGTVAGAANLISGSTGLGVLVYDSSSTNNSIRGNSIFNNAGGAILNYLGGNNSLAIPSLSSAVVTTNTVVSGHYNGANGALYQLDFYADAPPAFSAQAMTYLGSVSVPGTGGSAAFAANLGALLPAGRVVSATATDPAGNTSQLSTGVATTMTSSVNDGIPNAWRALYFGGSGTTTNGSSYVGGDPDHDGVSNYQEFFAGTNPTNAASVFKLTALDPHASTNIVSLNSASGIVYRVQYRDDLASGTWNLLADQIVGTGTNIFLTDLGAGALATRFYRAQVLW